MALLWTIRRRCQEPIIIDLNDLKIKKISCGLAHSLLLSCDIDIYELGWNRFGQIGNGTQETQRFSIKFELNNKFIDNTSDAYYRISMSRSINGICYILGQFKGKNFLCP